MLRFGGLRSRAARINLRRLVLILWPPISIALLGAAALSHPNGIWTSSIVSAAALLPLGMVIAARYGSEARRPLRYGFAIGCGGYFLFFTFFADSRYLENFATSKAINACYERFFPNSQASPMPSSGGGFGGFGGGGGFGGAVDTEVAQLEPGKGTFAPEQNTEPATSVSDTGQIGGGSGQYSTVTTVVPSTAQAAQAQDQQMLELARASNFWLIGHAWWALLFGWIGACLAQFMASRQAQPEADTNPTR